jgi:hypothetical protein
MLRRATRRAEIELERQQREPHVETHRLLAHRNRLERARRHGARRLNAAVGGVKRHERDPRARRRRLKRHGALVVGLGQHLAQCRRRARARAPTPALRVAATPLAHCAGRLRASASSGERSARPCELDSAIALRQSPLAPLSSRFDDVAATSASMSSNDTPMATSRAATRLLTRPRRDQQALSLRRRQTTSTCATTLRQVRHRHGLRLGRDVARRAPLVVLIGVVVVCRRRRRV